MRLDWVTVDGGYLVVSSWWMGWTRESRMASLVSGPMAVVAGRLGRGGPGISCTPVMPFLFDGLRVVRLPIWQGAPSEHEFRETWIEAARRDQDRRLPLPNLRSHLLKCH